YRSQIEQAVEILVDREGLDAPAALEWLGTAARAPGGPRGGGAHAGVGGGAPPRTGAPRPGRSGARPPTLSLPCTGGTRSCMRARPDGSCGAASLAERRPTVCRRPRAPAARPEP